MERVQEELLCFSTILRTISHSVRSQFGALDDSNYSNGKNRRRSSALSHLLSSSMNNNEKDKDSSNLLSPGSNEGENKKKNNNDDSDEEEEYDDQGEQHALSLDETIELLDLAGQLLESDNNSYRIRALLLETRPNIVEVLVGILASNPLSIVPPTIYANNNTGLSRSVSSATTGNTNNNNNAGSAFGTHLLGANHLRQDHEHVQRRFASLQWKAMSNLARACALAAPTEATASQFGFVLDSFDVLNIALRYLVLDEAGLSLRTCAAEVLFLCATKLQLAERASQSNETIDAIVFQLAESDHTIGGSGVIHRDQNNSTNNNGRSFSTSNNNNQGSSATEDTLRCYLVGTLHAIGPVERLLSADFIDVAIGMLRDGPVYACTKILDLLAQLFKRNPYFVPSSLPVDRVLLLCEALGGVLSRLGDHSDVVVAVCRVVEICAITSALAVEDEAIVKKTKNGGRGNSLSKDDHGPFGPRPAGGHQTSKNSRSHNNNNNDDDGYNNNNNSHPEDGPGRFMIFFCHEGQTGPWRKLLIAGKTDPSLVLARAQQMRAMRVLIQCLIDVGTMQRLADELSRDLPLFSALLSAPLRLPPFHDENGSPYVCEASLCLTFLMAKVPSFRANVRRAVATFPAWLQNLEQRLVEGMEAGLQNVASEISAIQLVDVCGNLLNSIGFVDRFAPRAWADVNALEVCVSRLFEFQLRVDPHEPRPTLSQSSAADDDGSPFVAVFVDVDRKAMVLTTGVLAFAICLSFQEIVNDKKYYDSASNSFLGGGQPAPYQQRSTSGNNNANQYYNDDEFQENARTFSTDPSVVANSLQNQNNNNNNNNARGRSQQSNTNTNTTVIREPNFVATDGVEVRTETSESRGTSEQSNLLHFSSNAATHNNGLTKPSPYSLHAMKVRGGGGSADPLSSFTRTGTHNNNNNNSAHHPGGFVQRNATGRFEPVEVIHHQNNNNNSAHTSLERNHHHRGGGTTTTSLPPAHLLPSNNHHQDYNYQDNNTNIQQQQRYYGGGIPMMNQQPQNVPSGGSRKSTSRPNSRKGTPTGSGPIVQQNRWK